jgi:hypothetical protein
VLIHTTTATATATATTITTTTTTTTFRETPQHLKFNTIFSYLNYPFIDFYYYS